MALNKNRILTAVLFFFFLYSCTKEENKQRELNRPEVSTANADNLSRLTVPKPKRIIADKSKFLKVKAGMPRLVEANLNVYNAGNPKRIATGPLRITYPGKDTLLFPKSVAVVDSPFYAGVPEVVIAKDMANKDQNPSNFSSFSKLQGLKHGNVRSLLEDHSGNLWFGTYGGACRYDGKTFTHFTEREGLSNNTILCMTEDKKGNIWFGTNGGGVTKYDGKFFTRYSKKEGLSDNVVWSILEDKAGNLWFGTGSGGVTRYDGKIFIHITTKQGLSDNTVLSIIEDKFGNIWFGTGTGACAYDGKSFKYFTEKNGLANNFVLSIKEDRLGNLWFGTGAGVSCYDGNRIDAIERGDKAATQHQHGLLIENGMFIKTFSNFSIQEGLSNNVVWSILEDKSSPLNETDIWFCTGGGGLTRYNGKTFTHFTDKEGLTSNIVWSALTDKSGNLWFGSGGGGVMRYDGKTFNHFTEREGLNNNIILAINKHKFLFEEAESLWFGTNGGGLTCYDGKSFRHYTVKEGLNNNLVRAIISDRHSNLWIGTDNGACYFDGKTFTHITEKEGLSNNIVLSILEDKSGKIWFGTNNGGATCYDGNSFTHYSVKDGLSNNTVWAILQDKNERLWFAADGGGLSCFNGKTFTRFSEKDGLNKKTVTSLLEDNYGNLWFGTDGGGVLRYDGKTFKCYTEKQGLASNVVMSMLHDKSGNLWFGTRFGLSKIDESVIAFLQNNESADVQQEEKLLFRSYDYTDGFLGVGVYGGKTMCEDSNGNIWIGANDRLTVYHPTDKDIKDTTGPNIQLTDVELFNENVAWSHLVHKKDTSLILGNGITLQKFEFGGISDWYVLPENLSLAYNNNYLTFSFIGITMKQPKKVKYKFKLEGNDDHWSVLSNRTEASYGNLAPGNYTFKVKAMNGDGYWSREHQYTFTIRPPWWRTWWAYTVYTLSALISLVTFIKWRERSLKKRQKELEEKIDEATLVIRNQKEEVEKQKEVVEGQKHLIEEKHKEITDSINYAERIQRSFLATKEQLDENLNDGSRYDAQRNSASTRTDKSGTVTSSLSPETSVKGGLDTSLVPRDTRPDTKSFVTSSADEGGVSRSDSNYFILFKPKDVVSGDFYWSATLNNGNFALVTADSTGHGVPGAIMSLLNITSLEKAIETETSPEKILNITRNIIIERLKKDGSIEGGKDGMDCSLCAFDFKNMKLFVAAANNPVWVMRSSLRGVPMETVTTKQSAPSQDEIASLPTSARNDEGGTEIKPDLFSVIEVKPDKMPVGKHDRQDTTFTLHEINLQEGDVVYTLTDGFPDQFGGPAGKKFMSKKLRELLRDIAHLPMQEQKLLLETTFNDWVGDLEQVDDVTLIGIRV